MPILRYRVLPSKFDDDSTKGNAAFSSSTVLALGGFVPNIYRVAAITTVNYKIIPITPKPTNVKATCSGVLPMGVAPNGFRSKWFRDGFTAATSTTFKKELTNHIINPKRSL